MLLTPIKICAVVWITVFFSFYMISDFYDSSVNYYIFVVILLVCFIFWAVIEGLFYKPFRRQFRPRLKLFSFKLGLCAFVLASLVEVFFSGNVPLVAQFGVGPYIAYTDYGVGGVHGLVNGLHLALAVACYVGRIETKEKVFLFILGGLIMWAIFLVSRQLLFSLFFLLFLTRLCLIENNLIRKSHAMRYACIFLAGIFCFWILGSIRGHDINLFDLLGYKSGSWLDNNGAFQWIVMYLSSPLNNMLNNMNLQGDFYNLFSPLVPSFIRGVFDVPTPYLSIEIFNVTTGFYIYNTVFGYLGVFFFISLIGLFSVSAGLLLRRGHPFGFAMYLFVSHASFFSFFADFLVNLPFLAFLFFCSIFLKYPQRGKCNA